MEDQLPDLNRKFLNSLSDANKINFLYETISYPHPAKWDLVIELVEKYLYDESDSGAPRLHAPIRIILQEFMIQGCPRGYFQDLYGLSGTALDKWTFQIGRKDQRFKAHSRKKKGRVTANYGRIFWTDRLYKFTVNALTLFYCFQGESENFYSFYLANYLETGVNVQPQLIDMWTADAGRP